MARSFTLQKQIQRYASVTLNPEVEESLERIH